MVLGHDAGSGDGPTILHLSCDFPDPMVGNKTPAVRNLIGHTPRFRHLVYSLNRVSWKWGDVAIPFAADRVAVAYGAPPKGLLLAGALDRLAGFLASDLEERGWKPDLIHAHKFSIEGLLGLSLGRRLGLPLVCSVWGNSDRRIIRARPDLRSRWQEVADFASLVLPATPWALEALGETLRVDPAKTVMVPIVPTSEVELPPTSGSTRLACVLRLDDHVNKGVGTLVAALAKLRGEFPDLALDLIGSGSPRAVVEVRELIGRAGMQGVVRLAGLVPNERMAAELNGCAAMVLPSRRESYGLVYVEALLAGVPILLSRGRGIDGFLPSDRIGYACNPDDVDDVAAGLRHIVTNQTALKASIAEMQKNGAFDLLKAASISRSYTQALDRLLAQR
jgi:glycosyltransferase involved in cell wall biosynthesis